MDYTKMELKDIIKCRRKELKLNLSDIAKACNVSEATVSRWESGDIGDMKRSRIASLSKILKISPSIIVGTTDEVYTNTDSIQKITQYLKDKPDLLELYNELLANDQLTLLFDKTKDLTPQDVESVLLFVQTIRKQRGMEE